MAVSIEQQGIHTAEPNVVPMIDIMLVLLIIFMIVTPIISAGFQAQMPMGRNIEPHPDEENDVILGIDRNGKYFMDPAKLPNGEIRVGEIGPVCRRQNCDQRRELEERLRETYSERTIDKILYFKADQNLTFGQIEEALVIARKAGVRVLAAVTEEVVEDRGVFARGSGN